jgi:eukaryotic-like serine/threonine-protein kinase
VTDLLDRLRSALGDRYELERQVGEGGMATVYRAKDLKHERTVAVKVLRQELSVSLGADRFLREIRVAANLQHPNILGLYDSGEAPGGLLFYVMPFIEGESLRDRLNKEQQLPIHDALQIVREAAEALHYAHERGIVHRDIKPENILLLGGHALVADFGIARAVTQASEEKLTQTGMAVGTPAYMSPEQSLGSEHVDARSDVYSLGCVLYEVLIGQPPFTGPNSMAIMARHSMEVVPSLQVVRASISDEVEDAVMQALEKTPADRFQTMKDFAERLSEAEAEAAMARTAQRRASTAARRASGAGAVRRRTGSAETPVQRRTPVQLVAAAVREGGVKFWSLSFAGLLLAAGIAFGGWKLAHRGGAAGGAPEAEADAALPPTHIAVLYFDQRGGSDSLTYLADGLTEALIRELSGVEGLQVISSNGVRPYKQGNTALTKIAQDLKVGTLVHGDVSQSGDKLRVSVSLAQASTGDEIGSKTLERPRGELFALQDDLSKEVAVFLRQQLGKEVLVRETRGTTRSVEAWTLYQRAEQEARDADALAAANDTAGASRKFQRTDSILGVAEARDPAWAAPSVLRGWLNYRQSRMFESADPGYHAAVITKGLEHAERALGLKADDADALELRGTLRYWKWLNNLGGSPTESAKLYADAEQDLRASVEQNPAQASAWTTLSHLLINKPALGEAKLAAMRAYTADPYLTNANITLWRLFSTSYQLDDAVEAKKWCDEGQRRFPEDYRFAQCQIWYYGLKAAKPDVPAAWAALEKYVRLSPLSSQPYNRLEGQMRVAIALARAGLGDSARRVAERSRGDASVDATRDLAQLEAIALDILGDKDAAFKQLSIWLASNPQQAESMSDDDSWELKDLREDPRFAATFKPKK